MDSIFNWLLTGVVITLVSLTVVVYSKVREPQNLKEIPSVPFWSSLYQNIVGVPFIEQTQELIEDFRKYGILKIFYRGQWLIYNGDSELFKKVVTDHNSFDKLTPHDFAPNCLMDQMFGTNIVFSNYQDWKKHRRAINPAFKKSWNLQVFVDCVEELFEKMDQISTDNVDIEDLIQRVTVEAMGREIMDVRFDGILPQEQAQFIRYFNDLIVTGLKPIYFIFLFLDNPWNPFRAEDYRKLDYINNYFDQLIKERKAKIAESNGDINRKDILSLMLESNINNPEGLTEEDIKHDTLLFFWAGQDTTTFTICTILHLLAEYPDIQDKVRQEILTVLGKDEYENGRLKTPTHEQLSRLEYVYAIIQESMRLYPAISSISNFVTIKDVNHRGYTIPKGTIIDNVVYAIHRNPDYFKEPNSFDPSRFLNNQIDTKKMDSNWFGFSGGSRNCIGSGFSLLQQKIVISYILRRYVVKPAGSLPSGKPVKTQTPLILKHDDLRLDFERI